MPNLSALFRTLRKSSERFRTLPQDAESFRNVPHAAERKEHHTLSVREVSRMFEAAGVARAERSIVNWCRANAHGIARLDAYYDPNERKYYITPQSVELAIAEEQAKAAKVNSAAEPGGHVPHGSEGENGRTDPDAESDSKRVRELEKEVMDLRITNRGKDYFIEQLQKERDGFASERRGYVEQLISSHRRVGELETQLLQLTDGTEAKARKLEVRGQFSQENSDANSRSN